MESFSGSQTGSQIVVLTETDLIMTDDMTDDESVDEAGIESFPASDPPSWTSGVDRVPLPPPASTPIGISAGGGKRRAAP